MTRDWPSSPPSMGTSDSSAWWVGLSEEELRIWQCECGASWVYSRARCAHCGSSDARLRVSSGHGRLLAVSIVRRLGAGTQVPFAVAVVETREGARLLSRVEAEDIEDVHPGAEVVAVFNDGLPTFRLDTESDS
ncbi:MAG: hypothetical protein GEU93_11450 [Propionibacteriales bacterium]|nr:hypothetical protein [Propionibacteriales bacterium]